MANPYWYTTSLISAQGDGGSLSNSTTATSILPATAKYTIPANALQVGNTFRVKAAGRLSNIVTTPGTLTLDLRMGSTITAFNGGAMQLSTSAHTTLPWYFDVLLTVRSIGSGTSATIMGQGICSSQCLSLTAVADSTTTPATLLIPNVTPVVGSGFDSTVANIFDMFATFSIANAANLIQLHQFELTPGF